MVIYTGGTIGMKQGPDGETRKLLLFVLLFLCLNSHHPIFSDQLTVCKDRGGGPLFLHADYFITSFNQCCNHSQGHTSIHFQTTSI